MDVLLYTTPSHWAMLMPLLCFWTWMQIPIDRTVRDEHQPIAGVQRVNSKQ